MSHDGSFWGKDLVISASSNMKVACLTSVKTHAKSVWDRVEIFVSFCINFFKMDCLIFRLSNDSKPIWETSSLGCPFFAWFKKDLHKLLSKLLNIRNNLKLIFLY